MHAFLKYAAVSLLFVVAIVCADSVSAQRNAAQIAALDEAKLVEILKDRDAPTFEKAKACQRLAVVGTKNAVPALAELLGDETLNVYARFGLEGIADPAADESLRVAAKKIKGRMLVGVIESIGQRHDANAVALLKELMNSSDAAVASAAIGALGHFGTVECAEALNAAFAKNPNTTIGDACLTCAERLAAAGKRAEALTLYRSVCTSHLPKQIHIAGLDGQLRLLGNEASGLLINLIKSEDEEYFRLALAAARRIPGVTESLAAQLDKLPPERQALLLRALGDRDEPVPQTVLRSATQNESPAVREAAILVLAKRGDASAADLLLDAALGGDDLAGVAKQGLESLSGAAVDQAIVARLGKATAKQTPILFDLVAARRIAAAKPQVIVEVALKDDSSEEPIRVSAITALGQLAESSELDLLIALAFGSSSSKEVATAKAALRTAAQRIDDRERTAERLAAELKQRTGEAHSFVFDLLGQIGGKTALQKVVASAKSDDAATKDSATRVLGEWPNADASAALMDIARNDSEQKYRIRTLRGFLRIARQLQLPETERLEMYRTAMELAKRDDERKLAIDILTRIPSSTTLALSVRELDKPALRDAAADAAVKIASKIIAQQPDDVSGAMRAVVSSGGEGDLAARARQLLNQAQGDKK